MSEIWYAYALIGNMVVGIISVKKMVIGKKSRRGKISAAHRLRTTGPYMDERLFQFFSVYVKVNERGREKKELCWILKENIICSCLPLIIIMSVSLKSKKG